MKTIGTLQILYSRTDANGNRSWALRFFDHETGREVCGTTGSAGESNINAIRRYWDGTGNWTNSIRTELSSLGIREFNDMTRGWAYAGSQPEELTAYIKNQLQRPVKV